MKKVKDILNNILLFLLIILTSILIYGIIDNDFDIPIDTYIRGSLNTYEQNL